MLHFIQNYIQWTLLDCRIYMQMLFLANFIFCKPFTSYLMQQYSLDLLRGTQQSALV